MAIIEGTLLVCRHDEEGKGEGEGGGGGGGVFLTRGVCLKKRE